MGRVIKDRFDDLITLTGSFVGSQKGRWDNAELLRFISVAQKRGFVITDRVKSYINLVLIAMQNFYDTAAPKKENKMSELSDHTVKFIKKTEGVWSDSELNRFIKGAKRKGIDLNDEARAYLNNILESSRVLYNFSNPIKKIRKEKTASKDN